MRRQMVTTMYNKLNNHPLKIFLDVVPFFFCGRFHGGCVMKMCCLGVQVSNIPPGISQTTSGLKIT